MPRARLFCLGLLPLLAGCAASPPAPPACALPRLRPMLALEFFMGRDIAGRPPLTDAEWNAFIEAEVTPRFPDGFTVIEASGQWRDPTGHTSREPSHVVRAWVPKTEDLPARIDAVAAAYKQRFHQLAVGVAITPGCADFSN